MKIRLTKYKFLWTFMCKVCNCAIKMILTRSWRIQFSHTWFADQESTDESRIKVSDNIDLWWVGVGEAVWICDSWPTVRMNVPHVFIISPRLYCIILLLLDRGGVLITSTWTQYTAWVKVCKLNYRNIWSSCAYMMNKTWQSMLL